MKLYFKESYVEIIDSRASDVIMSQFHTFASVPDILQISL